MREGFAFELTFSYARLSSGGPYHLYVKGMALLLFATLLLYNRYLPFYLLTRLQNTGKVIQVAVPRRFTKTVTVNTLQPQRVTFFNLSKKHKCSMTN